MENKLKAKKLNNKNVIMVKDSPESHISLSMLNTDKMLLVENYADLFEKIANSNEIHIGIIDITTAQEYMDKMEKTGLGVMKLIKHQMSMALLLATANERSSRRLPQCLNEEQELRNLFPDVVLEPMKLTQMSHSFHFHILCMIGVFAGIISLGLAVEFCKRFNKLSEDLTNTQPTLPGMNQVC